MPEERQPNNLMAGWGCRGCLLLVHQRIAGVPGAQRGGAAYAVKHAGRYDFTCLPLHWHAPPHAFLLHACQRTRRLEDNNLGPAYAPAGGLNVQHARPECKPPDGSDLAHHVHNTSLLLLERPAGIGLHAEKMMAFTDGKEALGRPRGPFHPGRAHQDDFVRVKVRLAHEHGARVRARQSIHSPRLLFFEKNIFPFP